MPAVNHTFESVRSTIHEFASCYAIVPITDLRKTLTELDLDSLDRVQLEMAIEDYFDVNYPEEVWERAANQSLEDIALMVWKDVER